MFLRVCLWIADLLARSLPARAGYALAALGGVLWHRADPERRRVVAVNLARVCQATGRPISGRAFHRMVRRAFIEHARYYLELLRAPHYPPDQIDRYVSVADWEQHAARLRSGQGTVVASLHLGNFEPFGTFLTGNDLHGVAPVEVIRPRALFDFLLSRRGGGRGGRGIAIVPLSEARKPMLAALRRGEIAALIADRDLDGRGVPVMLFGHATTMPYGPATLATLTASQLVIARCLRLGADRFEARAEWLDWEPSGDRRRDALDLTRRIAATFERWIAEHPEQWWGAFQPIWPDLGRRTAIAQEAASRRRQRRMER
jgi:phosphatidylinositol dimannoside acyltransferase